MFILNKHYIFIFLGGYMLKFINDLIKVFSDIKKFEKTKTLHRDKNDDLNNLNNELLIFMINKH